MSTAGTASALRARRRRVPHLAERGLDEVHRREELPAHAEPLFRLVVPAEEPGGGRGRSDADPHAERRALRAEPRQVPPRQDVVPFARSEPDDRRRQTRSPAEQPQHRLPVAREPRVVGRREPALVGAQLANDRRRRQVQ
jgi:hypothetical protein